MSISSVFTRRNPGGSPTRVGPRRRCRPQVEALEPRLTPSFTPVGPVAVGSQPLSVAVGDFNGDGKPDLAVANFASSSVSIRLGTGGGGFSTVTDVAVSPLAGPQFVAVGDFNGDGKLDLAIANFKSNTVSIRLGAGGGAFTSMPDVAVGRNPSSVAVADFNGDGKPDLAVANSTDTTVSICRGDGSGGFTVAPFSVGDSPESVAVADFNGDGKLDFAATSALGIVSIRLGTSLGVFVNAPDVVVGSGPSSVAVGDFNGDGQPDLAVANELSNSVSFRLGNGTGAFTSMPDVAVGDGPFSVAVADFNGDGKQDLAIANLLSNSGTVSLRLGNGSGAFTAEPDLPVGTGPTSVAVGDFNGDGKPDLAAVNFGSNSVTILLNTFPSPTPPAPPLRQITAAAFRQKGVAKVRVKDATTGAVRAVLTPFKGFAGRLRLQLVDVNGDGSLDLVVKATVRGKRKTKVFDAVTLTPLPPALA